MTESPASREFPLPRAAAWNVLLVVPRFNAHSFWSFEATLQALGAKCFAAPLGMITVAALLPPEWTPRLVDRNVEELREADIDCADLVLTGGMLPQQVDTLRIIRMARRRNKMVVVGGPDVTCSPHVYEEADFRVLGEAEEVMPELVTALRAGAERGTFRATRFPDLARSPVPRFDLLRFDQYFNIGVQLSRGCPYRCEFCNVIELNGRAPRLKTPGQILRELDALYALGYRGHVDFVDDNFVGSPRAVKPVLTELTRWLEAHSYPFEFSTEVSLNVEADDELLQLMRRANFFACFVGIETPDPTELRNAHKTQNLGRSVPESVARIVRAGMFVMAGFIIGFDGEGDRVSEGLIACIEDAAIPICMVGLLYALPNTQLARRLSAEGRLHADSDRIGVDDADQCTSGLNFATRRPRRDALGDYQRVLAAIYAPSSYFGRVRQMTRALDRSSHRLRVSWGARLLDMRTLGRVIWRLGVRDPESRVEWWRTFLDCLAHNPRAFKAGLTMSAFFLHLKAFAAFMRAQIDERLATIAAEDARGLAK